MLTDSELKDLRECAVAAATAAGALLRQGYSEAKEIKHKDGVHNLVTQFDLRSEALIISAIRDRFPEHQFLAEESGGQVNDSGFRWIIDPLDGTVNFAHAIPIFSVSIAVELDAQPLVGVVYQPMLDELFVAVRGQGATLNGTAIQVSATDSLAKSILVTGFPYDVHKNAIHTMEHFSTLVHRGIPIRRLGSAAVDLAYVACGRFEGFWESALAPWDVAAGVLLVREAGGIVSDFSGLQHKHSNHTILATNGAVHAEFVELLGS